MVCETLECLSILFQVARQVKTFSEASRGNFARLMFPSVKSKSLSYIVNTVSQGLTK